MGFENYSKTKKGKEVENQFIEKIKIKRPYAIIVTASTHQNRNEHWDFEINGKKIDVKSEKNTGLGNSYTILEIIDVYGTMGWLYGNADYIAFQSGDSFIITSRKRLVDYHQKTTKNIKVTNLKEAINKKYSRTNDIITVIPFSDIIAFSYKLKT